MNRKIEQWRNCTPGAMATSQSKNARVYAFIDAKHDILELYDDAIRYKYLRNRSLNTIENGGVFAGLTPENVILNGADLDRAIDDAILEDAEQVFKYSKVK